MAETAAEAKQSKQPATRPGLQYQMPRQPQSKRPSRRRGRLSGKIALITGGDSGIGRAVAIAFAQEGADVAIAYLNEHRDAAKTKQLVEAEDRRAVTLAGDIGDPENCLELVRMAKKALGPINILVNNAAEQSPRQEPEEITPKQLLRTFQTNVFSMFYLTQAALADMKAGDAIINSASVVAFKGHETLLDYSSSKGAIVAFTRSLALMVADRGIRVNAVAPGPIWTPLIPSTFPPDKIKKFGKDTALGRPGQPEEVAPAYVFLASNDASYMTGQTIHVNGGAIVNA